MCCWALGTGREAQAWGAVPTLQLLTSLGGTEKRPGDPAWWGSAEMAPRPRWAVGVDQGLSRHDPFWQSRRRLGCTPVLLLGRYVDCHSLWQLLPEPAGPSRRPSPSGVVSEERPRGKAGGPGVEAARRGRGQLREGLGGRPGREGRPGARAGAWEGWRHGRGSSCAGDANVGRAPVGLGLGSPHLDSGQGTDVVDLMSTPLARHSSQGARRQLLARGRGSGVPNYLPVTSPPRSCLRK